MYWIIPTGSYCQQSLSCQMLTGGAPLSISQPLSSCIVPNITGPVAIYITNSTQPLANNQQIQFTQEIVMGPTIAFIDSGAEAIMQLVRTSSSDSSDPSGTSNSSAPSTTTISPAEASSIIAGASSTTGSLPADPTSDGDSNLSTGDATSNTATDGNTVVIGWSSAPAPQPAS